MPPYDVKLSVPRIMSRWRIATVLIALGVVGLARTMEAQSGASVAVGMTSIRFDSTAALSTLSIAPTYSRASERTSLWLMGSGAQLPNAAWSAQLFAAATASTPASMRGFVGEIGAMGGGSAHADGARTGQGMGTLRLAQWRTLGGWWTGVQGGVTYDGVASNSVVRGDIGATRTIGRAQWALTALPTWTRAVVFTDAELQLAVPLVRMDLAASVGARSGAALPVYGRDERVWGTASALYYVTPRAAIVLSAGTYPIDLTQGFPSGRYASVALRVQSARRTAAPLRGTNAQASVITSGLAVEPVLGSSVQVVDGTPVRRYRVRLRLDARDARFSPDGRTAARVQLNGSVTHWEPVAMRSDGAGYWVWEGDIPDGMHDVVVQVNDGGWLVPPGVPAMRDEFGGEVGRLAIGV